MTQDFFRKIVKDLNDENTTIAEDGLSSSQFSGCIDTGSYILNAALSGSLYGGVPNNKITAFAGESATGKTFFVLGVVKRFLDDNPTGAVFYFDTEAAVTKEMMSTRGIDTKRVIISEPETIQKFRHTVLQLVDNYAKEKDRPPMLMVLDSLGQLSSTKELEDTATGSETRDMTKAATLKATFRVLNLKLAKINVPMLITNHVYDVVGSYIPTKENKQVEVLLTYDKGLDRYYGLLDIAEKYDIFRKVSNRYELTDGSKVYGKVIQKDPEKYFTKDVMEKIEKAVEKEFLYGDYVRDTEVSVPEQSITE